MSGFTGKLDSYTMTQLNELLEDDEKLNHIVQELEETQTVQQAKDMTLAGNRSLAEQNLLLQPQLDLQKNELTKRYRLLQELFEAYQLRKSTLDQHAGSGSLDTLLALLQAEGAKIEEETENMADSFLEGGQSLDSFIDEYQSKRKLAHVRRVKIDKLREMVLKGHRLPQAPVPSHNPTASPALNPTSDTNGSPMPPLGEPPTSPAQSTPPMASQPAGYPYPPCPYPVVPSRGYPTPFQFSPTLPEGPPPHLGPQPGFILQ